MLLLQCHFIVHTCASSQWALAEVNSTKKCRAWPQNRLRAVHQHVSRSVSLKTCKQEWKHILDEYLLMLPGLHNTQVSNRWWTQQGLEELEYPALDWRAGRAASRPHGGHSILLLLLLLVLVLLFFSAPCSQWQQQSQRGRGPIRRTWGGNKSGGATDGEVEPPSSPPPPHHHHHHHHHQHQHRVFISATSTQMTTTSSTFLLLPPISQNRAGPMWKNCPNHKRKQFEPWGTYLKGLFTTACKWSLSICLFLFVCVWGLGHKQAVRGVDRWDGSAPHPLHTLSGTPTPLLT